MVTIEVELPYLTIKIPIKTLVFATENHSDLATFDEEKNDFKKVIVNDEIQWALDVKTALNSEIAEDGSTLVTEALDAAIVKAAEYGTDSLYIEGIDN